MNTMDTTLRRELIETALAMNASGLNQGRIGNLSVRVDDGMLITPSGMEYESLVEEDIVCMGLDGAADGTRRPSSEWRFHAAIYRERPEARAVLHAHPLYCTALACTHRGIPALHYMVAVAGGRDIRCANYAIFGSEELSTEVLRALEGRTACLMANHGMVCFSDSLASALELGLEVELLAAIYCKALAIGGERLLSEAEMDGVLEKFSGYRVARD
jgi:L-fuculose-phosphate aldolase